MWERDWNVSGLLSRQVARTADGKTHCHLYPMAWLCGACPAPSSAATEQGSLLEAAEMQEGRSLPKFRGNSIGVLLSFALNHASCLQAILSQLTEEVAQLQQGGISIHQILWRRDCYRGRLRGSYQCL